jgi:putative peptidoglycan lipid II flippase
MSRLARSALLVAFFYGLEKSLGFLRQILIARQFGLSAELDAFNAANNLPDLLFALFSGGALAMPLIPVLSEYLEHKGRPQAWDLFSQIANLVFLVTATFSIVIALLAGKIVGWQLGIAPGFSEAQQSLVIELMRLNLVATLLFSTGGILIAGLHANQHFLLPALAPSLYDLGSFFGILVLAPTQPYHVGFISIPAFGMGVYGLVYGVILGAFLFFIVQIPGLIRFGFRWKPHINLHHSGMRQVLSLMAPRVLTVFFIHLVFLTQDNIASRLVTGSVTALAYGWLFMQVPESLIGTTMGTVLLPTLSGQNARLDKDAFQTTFLNAMKVLLSLTIPITVLLFLTIKPVITILGFDSASTELVTWTVRGFLVGLAGHSLLEVAVRGFYARQDAKTPLLAAGLAALFFILLGSLFGHWWGAPGIGVANSVVYTCEALFLWWLLNRQVAEIFKLKNTLMRVVVASIVGGLTVYGFMQLPIPSLPLAIGAACLGGLLVIPFIWPEMKLLIKL